MEPAALQLIQDKQQSLVTEDQIITPLRDVLASIAPRTNNKPSSFQTTTQTFQESLNELFPEQEYREKRVKQALKILGDLTNKLTIDEIQTIVVETEYLCESLLDTYERQIFKGKTLKELLNEG